MNLTKEEIEAMPAGRELDKLLAEYVFKEAVLSSWPCGVDYDSGILTASTSNPTRFPTLYNQNHPVTVWDGRAKPVPFYSIEVTAAKQVQEKLFADGYDFQIWRSHDPSTDGPFLIQASKNSYHNLNAPETIWATAQTEELATCRLALLATL